MIRSLFSSTFRIVVFYAAFGALWVFASDRVLEALVADHRLFSAIQTVKGWLFVAASSAVLAVVIRRELRARAGAEAGERASEVRYRSLFETANDAVFLFDAGSGVIIDANRRAEELLDMPRGSIIGMRQADLHPAAEAAQCGRMFEEVRKQGRILSSDFCMVKRGGAVVPVEISAGVITQDGRTLVQSFVRDITLRRHAEDQARFRLEHLRVLHAVDLIISSSLDLRVTLSEILGLVSNQLSADAAGVLLLNPHTLILEYAAGQGFRTSEIEQSRLRMGEGVAGTAALEHRSIGIPDLLAPDTGFLRAPLLEREGFLAYYAVPLFAKGQVKGVLEVFFRAAREIDPERLEFLEALAAQAAIAIDNAALFNDLQRSNIELALAYDATLEGWARALDLRSHATERHTRRVTDMTLRLARAMGMKEADLVHVRRGALLHDMGKIGVPDHVLLKPGPLTDEEWELMRKHPLFAFEMLQPIAYLRPALDIPYAHHEHWDGTGYPRGLKGEQIPLAARIFTVVDIWDAMTDPDRPYRKPLSDEEIRSQISGLAGTQLDPKVVEVFLGMQW